MHISYLIVDGESWSLLSILGSRRDFMYYMYVCFLFPDSDDPGYKRLVLGVLPLKTMCLNGWSLGEANS